MLLWVLFCKIGYGGQFCRLIIRCVDVNWVLGKYSGELLFLCGLLLELHHNYIIKFILNSLLSIRRHVYSMLYSTNQSFVGSIRHTPKQYTDSLRLAPQCFTFL